MKKMWSICEQAPGYYQNFSGFMKVQDDQHRLSFAYAVGLNTHDNSFDYHPKYTKSSTI